MANVTLSANENIRTLAELNASGKLPTEVTVTDGSTPAVATITDWTGDFDGTKTGSYQLAATWTIPVG